MPKRISPSKKATRNWFLHLLVFLIVNAVLWFVAFSGKEGWVYPWPAWITAAWGLTVVAHATLVWGNHEDSAHDEFHRQVRN